MCEASKTRRAARPSRPCECGTDCGRTASGGHRLSRTCRAQAPLREEVARLTDANERLGNDWGLMQDCITATHEILDGANVSRAHHLGGGLSLEGRVEQLVRNRDTWQELAADYEAEREALKESHDRLANICDEWSTDCSDLASRVRTLSDMLAREEAEHAAFRQGADAALEQVKRERDARDKDAAALTTRLRLSWAVSGVLAIGLAVAGLLLWGVWS